MEGVKTETWLLKTCDDPQSDSWLCGAVHCHFDRASCCEVAALAESEVGNGGTYK